MIKLATVFSGIGAIEHALDRMQLEHKIVFACDNGDVDILTKDVGMDIDDIGTELKALKNTIGKIHYDGEVQDLYKDQLVGMLSEANSEYDEIVSQLAEITDSSDDIKELLDLIIKMEDVKKARAKEYQTFLNGIDKGSKEEQILKGLQIILEISNDFKKDNSLDKLGKQEEFESSDGIVWSEISSALKELYDYLEANSGKKIIRKVQDLSQRTSQLHEKINYIAVQRELEALGDDWKARKKYVDSLYSGLESRNKVKQSYMANYELCVGG